MQAIATTTPALYAAPYEASSALGIYAYAPLFILGSGIFGLILFIALARRALSRRPELRDPLSPPPSIFDQ